MSNTLCTVIDLLGLKKITYCHFYQDPLSLNTDVCCREGIDMRQSGLVHDFSVNGNVEVAKEIIVDELKWLQDAENSLARKEYNVAEELEKIQDKTLEKHGEDHSSLAVAHAKMYGESGLVRCIFNGHYHSQRQCIRERIDDFNLQQVMSYIELAKGESVKFGRLLEAGVRIQDLEFILKILGNVFNNKRFVDPEESCEPKLLLKYLKQFPQFFLESMDNYNDAIPRSIANEKDDLLGVILTKLPQLSETHGLQNIRGSVPKSKQRFTCDIIKYFEQFNKGILGAPAQMVYNGQSIIGKQTNALANTSTMPHKNFRVLTARSKWTSKRNEVNSDRDWECKMHQQNTSNKSESDGQNHSVQKFDEVHKECGSDDLSEKLPIVNSRNVQFKSDGSTKLSIKYNSEIPHSGEIGNSNKTDFSQEVDNLPKNHHEEPERNSQPERPYAEENKQQEFQRYKQHSKNLISIRSRLNCSEDIMDNEQCKVNFAEGDFTTLIRVEQNFCRREKYLRTNYFEQTIQTTNWRSTGQVRQSNHTQIKFECTRLAKSFSPISLKYLDCDAMKDQVMSLLEEIERKEFPHY